MILYVQFECHPFPIKEVMLLKFRIRRRISPWGQFEPESYAKSEYWVSACKYNDVLRFLVTWVP